MGDISIRGKGKALKMKKGGSPTERRKKAREDKPSMVGPKTRRPGPTIKPLRPRPKPMPRDPKKVPEFRPLPRDPKKVPEFKPRPRPRPKREPEAKPMPMPMPRPDRPKVKPMPDKRPRLPKDLEKYFMKTPRRAIPLMKKDGGEMKSIAAMFGKGAMRVSAEKLKKAFEQAKKMKPTGRINTDDLKKALGMLSESAKAAGFKGKPLFKKTEPKIRGRSGGPKTSPAEKFRSELKRKASDALKRQSKIKDPKNKNKRLI